MSIYSIGDQARAHALQSAASRLKITLNALTEELASGEVSDIGRRVQGNTQNLRDIESKIVMAEQFLLASSEVGNLLKMMSEALGSVQSLSSTVAIELINEPMGENASLLAERSGKVARDFDLITSRLNVEIGGQHMFSGSATDMPPLISGSEMLDILEGMVSGSASADDVAQAVSDWFDAPAGSGGFLDIAYRGSTESVRELLISWGQVLSVDVHAGTKGIRDTLKGLAMSALAHRDIFSGNTSQHRELMRLGGKIIYDNDSLLVSEQAKIGSAERIVQNNSVELKMFLDGLRISTNEIRVADPYATSLALTETEARLQTLFAVTDRLSRLKLVEYLR